MQAFNERLIADVRTHGRPTEGPFVDQALLLLTTVGARSGRSRTAPLVFTREGDRYVIVASKGGAPTHPAWYHNLRAHPNVLVEVDGERFHARARIAHEPERRRLYDAHAAVFPAFHAYERRTARRIPVVTLERLP